METSLEMRALVEGLLECDFFYPTPPSKFKMGTYLEGMLVLILSPVMLNVSMPIQNTKYKIIIKLTA